MDKLKTDKTTLKKFSLTLGSVLLLLSVFFYIKHKNSCIPFVLLSGIFFLIALIRPQLLKSFYIIWMRLAFVLSWMNTRLILCVMFYFVFTPIGLIMKMFRIDPLERCIDKARQTYWITKEKKGLNLLDYERQF